MRPSCPITAAAAGGMAIAAVCLIALSLQHSPRSTRTGELPVLFQPTQADVQATRHATKQQLEKVSWWPYRINWQNGLSKFSKHHSYAAPVTPTPTHSPSYTPWDYPESSQWGHKCQWPNQSPIDIKTGWTGITTRGNDTVYLNYMKSKGLGIQNDGHTIVGSGDALKSHKLTIDSYDYFLKRFYFRRPSEHTIDGQRYPLEVQLEHIAANGKMVMLAILFEDGGENKFLEELNWNHLPHTVGKGMGISADIKMNDLIPGYNEHNWFRYYMYIGSMTFPPCFPEGWSDVRWVVAKTPTHISQEQLSKFPFHDHTRPIQKRRGRTIVQNAPYTQAPSDGPSHTPTTLRPSDGPTSAPTTPTPSHVPTTGTPTLPPTRSPSGFPSFAPDQGWMKNPFGDQLD